ncbi:MAG: anthranilate synthase component I family protein [Planctomycetes bacterium]|nr:anthranilate synthase component I family protein [Planctomycetota bacterium]
MDPETHLNATAKRVRLECTPLERSLSLDGCAEPLTVTQRLRELGTGAGSVLFESGDFDGALPTLRWSFVVARALVRLRLRSGTWRVEPSCDSGREVAAILRSRAEIAAEPCAAHDDGSRLRASSSLDLLRDASMVLRDVRPATLPPGVFGAIAYDFVDAFEELGPRKPDPLDEPDASFVLVQDVIVFDHAKRRVHLIARGLPHETLDDVRARLFALEQAVRPGEATRTLARREPRLSTGDADEAEFIEAVQCVKRHIVAGDVFQAVLSRRVVVESAAPPLEVYRALRQENPSPYMFCLELEPGSLLGASPETFLRVEDGDVEIRPIAGTALRARRADGNLDDERDRRLALALLLDEKELAEHMMLVDLARNDVARVSVPGTTRVVEALAIERYAHVQHLVSRVRGRLRPGLDALHAYRAAANTGTLTGAPKPRAMRLLRELEPTARGFYGGAVGYLLADGRFDSCIAIRSLRGKDGRYVVQSGAGIVHDSDPAREFAETCHKARACLTAVAMAEGRP